jgi:hypothetical protein
MQPFLKKSLGYILSRDDFAGVADVLRRNAASRGYRSYLDLPTQSSTNAY